MDFPSDLKYTAEHEWMRSTADGVRVGITDYAQDQLGDIVFVELPQVGATVEQGATMCEIESTKSVGEVYAPFAGTVTAVNETVIDSPELINSDPYGDGWLVEMQASDGVEQSFLDADAYRALVE